jgi:peroxiredoxin/tetratricopeptide (TPR) repeat protein
MKALLCCILTLGLLPCLLRADDASVPAGHSMHGEAFNEGPRQQAYLMGGTGKVNLTITTKHPQVQAFFNQGLGQLHGFWYFEAERSFRQAALLDPECAMAYWGMAMANVNTVKRAKGFITKAKDLKAKASPREQRWIDAYALYWLGTKSEKDRRQELANNLEDLSYDFPEELEAKAFLALHLWDSSGKGLAIVSRQTIDALLGEVFAAEPMHPAHHYRIHLWDSSNRAKRALKSAAACGQSSPNIAHMWHMSGHIYVKVHRWADAVWQQEASARVDHKHMMHDRILPDQIHNYAHNNQWLVEDLEFVGRVHDAVALAKNLIELPRHPRYNTLNVKADGTPYNNRGSSPEGRRRLYETLTRYELWDELIALGDTMYLEPTDIFAEQVKRLRWLGVAHFEKGHAKQGNEQLAALEAMRIKLIEDRRDAVLKAEAKAREAKLADDKIAKAMSDAYQRDAGKVTTLDTAIKELQAYAALAQGDKKKAGQLFDEVKDIPKDRLARLWLTLGNPEKALKLSREFAKEGADQVFRLAQLIDVLHRGGKTEEAKKEFDKLLVLSAEIDLDVPLLQRLAPVVKALKLPADWRVPKVPATDVGVRPELATLGPLHWQPSPAPAWSLPDEHGKQLSLADYRGRPVVVIFFLGNGCPHCIEQLNAFEPEVSAFAKAGISLVAISTDSVDGLRKTFEKSKLPDKIPLVSDHDFKAFKTYRAFDEFENIPLHGTFLIDGAGLVRWQDISFEPFREPKFLLTEAKRLLGMPVAGSSVASVK